MSESKKKEDKGTKLKEPIQYPKLWIVMAILIAFNVPWIFPEGTIRPLIGGWVPIWAFVSFLSTLGISIWISIVIRKYWKLEPGGN